MSGPSPTKNKISTDVLNSLIESAWRARENAYAPYSKFKVGSTIFTASGKIYSGCNVENASTPTGICAERNAICQAIAVEGPSVKLKHCIVVTEADIPTQPCGMCRQVLAEFGVDCLVTSVLPNGNMTQMTVDELLPRSFGPHTLPSVMQT